MTTSAFIDRLAAGLVVFLTFIFALGEWGLTLPKFLVEGTALAVIALLTLRVKLTRMLFVFAGIGLTLWLGLAGESWLEIAARGLSSAAFIAAFFTALSTLRNVAETSPALRRVGNFLAAQPPGRRYAALTVGGHLFALLINYGSISLLGGLASQSARSEADPKIREIRTRRMLLAIQRGFISSLTWSPLAFSLALATVLIPGASWATAALPGLMSGAIIMLIGWAMDWIFKPRLANPPPRMKVEGSWTLMTPLVVLLALLAVSVLGFHRLLDIRVVGTVMVVVPVIALCWAIIQHAGEPFATGLGARAVSFVNRELPGYRGELILLMMAGYIGTVGAPVLQPIVVSLGLHPEALPAWAVLTILVWLIPLLGQFGMNPILAFTLIAPLIPHADTLGVAPSAIVVAIVSGWALTGATSPFTATTLLIGSFAKVSAIHVGLKWNGGYFLTAAVAVTGWVLVYGLVL